MPFDSCKSKQNLLGWHMNPSPTNIGIHVQAKLLLPGSSSQMAFSSHGPPGSMQSTVCEEQRVLTVRL